MGRAASADEVARAIAWIASPEASFVTGAVLPVNGGMSAA
jgi:NAD(P)-dependent dehydrogenase (short-subunit alcohol dehydrogenase family)